MDLLNLSDWKEFFNYWLLNEGLVLPLLAVAAAIGSRFHKKVLLAVIAVFVLGNTVQLSRDLGGHNHKVINLWRISPASSSATSWSRSPHSAMPELRGYRV